MLPGGTHVSEIDASGRRQPFFRSAAQIGRQVALGLAQRDVREGPRGDVPAHLRDAHYRSASTIGHGEGYVYPHDRPGAFVDQEYRPAALAGNRYYEPSDRGHEAVVAERLRRWRGGEPAGHDEGADRVVTEDFAERDGHDHGG